MIPARSFSFQSLSTFSRRAYGSNYSAFPVDPVNEEIFGGLNVTYVGKWTAFGMAGGPFDPPTRVYRLKNYNDITIHWSSAIKNAHITLSSSSGTLLPGEATDVTATIDANALSAGSYEDAIIFVNDTDGIGGAGITVKIIVTAAAIPQGITVSHASDYNLTMVLGQLNTTPSDFTYIVTNTASIPIDVSLSYVYADALYDFILDGLPAGGHFFTRTIAAGGTLTVNCRWHGAVYLSAGTYFTEARFTNSTNGIGTTTRKSNLVLSSPSLLRRGENVGSGSMSMIGFPEYTSASSPPKKYLERTLSGDNIYCMMNGGGACSNPPIGTTKWTYSGVVSYDANDGSYSNTGNYEPLQNWSSGSCTVGAGAVGAPVDINAIPDGWDVFDSGTNIITVTRLTRTVTGLGTCATVGGGFGFKSTAGHAGVETIANEDDEGDAIIRGITWTGYNLPKHDLDGTTDTTPATYQARELNIATPFDFLYGEVKMSWMHTALLPNTNYIITFDVETADPSTAYPWTYSVTGSWSIAFTTDAFGAGETAETTLSATRGTAKRYVNPVVTIDLGAP